MVQSQGLAYAGRPGALVKKSTVANKKSILAKAKKGRSDSKALNVYHASTVKFAASLLKTNSNGLLHVSTRASFSAQYGPNLSVFKLRTKKLFRLEQHKALLLARMGDHRLSTAGESLGINVHRDFKLHATLKDLGFRGYEYKQYDGRRDRYITNYALFDAKLLTPQKTVATH